MFIMVLCNTKVFASESDSVHINQNSVSTRQISFEEMVQKYLQHTDTLKVNGNNGIDLTDPFISILNSNVSNKNYNAIRDYMNNYVESVYFRDVEEIKYANARASYVSKYVQDYATKMITNGDNARGYIIITVGGNITYNRNTGQITNAYNPKVVNVEYADLAWWTMTPTNIQASARISSDKYTAYFTGSVRSYGVHDDATYLKFDFGTASVTITATGD